MTTVVDVQVVERFQITTFEGFSSMWSRVADQSILAGLTREDVLEHVTRGIDGTVEGFARGISRNGRYSYRDALGKLCIVEASAR